MSKKLLKLLLDRTYVDTVVRWGILTVLGAHVVIKLEGGVANADDPTSEEGEVNYRAETGETANEEGTIPGRMREQTK